MDLTKTLELGKVAYYGGSKINAVTLELRLSTPQNNGPHKHTIDMGPVPDDAVCLSIVGSIWDEHRTDIVTGGQIVGDVRRLFPDERVQAICRIWDRWHLNDMRAGTRAQHAYYLEHLRKLESEGPLGRWDYDRICSVLNEGGLYEDQGYKYGHEWLHEVIPADVVEEIQRLFQTEGD